MLQLASEPDRERDDDEDPRREVFLREREAEEDEPEREREEEPEREVDFLLERREDFLLGTLPPSRRASERPIAMACLRLVTFLPERPLRSVPRLALCMARSTFFDAFFPYLAIVDLQNAGQQGISSATAAVCVCPFGHSASVRWEACARGVNRASSRDHVCKQGRPRVRGGRAVRAWSGCVVRQDWLVAPASNESV